MRKYKVILPYTRQMMESYILKDIQVIAADDDVESVLVREAEENESKYEKKYGDTDFLEEYPNEYDEEVELLDAKVKIIFHNIEVDESIDPEIKITKPMVYEAEYKNSDKKWYSYNHRDVLVSGDDEGELGEPLAVLLSAEPGVIEVGNFVIEDVDISEPLSDEQKENELAGTLFLRDNDE